MPSLALARRLEGIAAEIPRAANRFIRYAADEIGTALIPGTPVDTGYARANWRPSLNAPALVPLSLLDPTGAATRARLNTVARRYKPGDTLFLVNRTPYIGRLNEGSSKQADPDFIRERSLDGFEKARNRIALDSVVTPRAQITLTRRAA